MFYALFIFFCAILFLSNNGNKYVNNLTFKKKIGNQVNLRLLSNKRNQRVSSTCDKLLFVFFKNKKKWNGNIRNKRNIKNRRIYFERNGINVPQDIAMFGNTNVYYIRESIYNKNENNLVPNEIDNEYIEELNNLKEDDKEVENKSINNAYNHNAKENNNTNQTNSEEISDVLKYPMDSNFNSNNTDKQDSMQQNKQFEKKKKNTNTTNNIFTYINQDKEYISQVENSPKVDVYERRYKADEKKIYTIFENINEVNIQLLKDIKSIDEKEKLINKRVIEKVREDIKKYQETNEIMDIKGNMMKPSTENKNKSKEDTKEKNNLNSDMDEEEKNEVIKKLYMIDKKTEKYLEENVYFVIQTWLPDIRIDDTLIVIDSIEKLYNNFDISKYYEKFKEMKNKNFSYDISSYEIENIPKDINDDNEIECEHIRSYNNTYNKLNNYNQKKYSYTYTTNENMDTKIVKNEPMPPIVLINTKKNLMVQEWECKNFKNRQKHNKAYEYTRIQRAFRPFSYIDLSDITCIYKNNYLQLKMKLSHRKYKNDIYPFFVPINKNMDDLLDFNGYKKNGDSAWSFFWHNFKYDQNTDYNFLNRNVKLNLTETKFEEINKKKSKKIMKKIQMERKGK
ncbi:conserved protein, unknown function [Hepatocystis sp. ex Piliocolobus tephrosceles]|nr:conserved protein, unknown function [Hepatocystis sp. ex Piliocolobus tephrosceles]